MASMLMPVAATGLSVLNCVAMAATLFCVLVRMAMRAAAALVRYDFLFSILNGFLGFTVCATASTLGVFNRLGAVVVLVQYALVFQ